MRQSRWRIRIITSGALTLSHTANHGFSSPGKAGEKPNSANIVERLSNGIKETVYQNGTVLL